MNNKKSALQSKLLGKILILFQLRLINGRFSLYEGGNEMFLYKKNLTYSKSGNTSLPSTS